MSRNGRTGYASIEPGLMVLRLLVMDDPIYDRSGASTGSPRAPSLEKPTSRDLGT
jgi:hypothetical protein